MENDSRTRSGGSKALAFFWDLSKNVEEPDELLEGASCEWNDRKFSKKSEAFLNVA